MNARWYKRDDWSLSHGNIGDIISPIITEFVLRLPVTYSEAPGSVLGCGSILEFIQPNDILFGCGLIQPMQLPYCDNVKIIGVRGELSKTALNNSGYDTTDCLLFDPAIFMPLIYHPCVEQTRDTITIPHYIDTRQYKFPTLSPLVYYKQFIYDMCQYNRVKTNSLHAFILAEAYGIEAELIDLHPDIIGGSFKYEDYETSNKKLTLNQVYERMSTLSIY